MALKSVSDQFLISLINHTEDLIVFLSLDGKIIIANPVFADFVGYSDEKLIGEKIEPLLKKLNIDIFGNKHIKELTELPQDDLECHCKSYAGNDHDILWSYFFLQNENEASKYILLLGKDITELKKLDQQVVRLDNIIKYAPDWIYWKDKNSIHLGANDQFATVAGLQSREQIIGKSDHSLPWGKNADKYVLDDKEVISSGQPRLNIEDVVPLENGKIVTVITNKVPLRDAKGDVIGVLGIATDITDRKKTEEDLLKAKEEAEKANHAKTEFLQNMRHDLRTPITGISGFANIIKEEVQDPQIKEYADNIIASGDALLDVVNEILEAVHFDSGEIPFYKNKFDLERRIQTVIDLNLAKAHEKHIEMELYYDPTLPKYFVGDSKRVHRIILELVTNALNFTTKGTVNISVLLARKTDNNIIIKIIVADTGIGIPFDKQHEIFARFKRLHPSFEGIYKGAGLGLTIVNQFIDDLEGEIYVESKEGKGSSFICIIPLKEALIDDDENVEIVVDTPRHMKKTLSDVLDVAKKLEKTEGVSKILVVEDDNLAAKAATIFLGKCNCVVDVAPDGNTALKMVNENSYDLIFMDVGLPDISGIEVTKRIRLLEWNTDKPMPIIALTAHVESEDKHRCIEAGMNAVLSKPMPLQIVGEILDAFIPLRAAKKQIVTMTNNLREEEAKLLDLSGPVIDCEAALERCNNEDLFKEMLETFFNDFEQELIEMSEAHKKNDWKIISAVAHKISGGCSYCSATRLKDASSRIEKYIKSENTGELKEQLYQQLLREIEAVKQEILVILARK